MISPEDLGADAERVEEFLSIMERMASGEFDLKAPVSSRRDTLDSIAFGVNVLAGELAYRQRLRLADMGMAKDAAEQANKAKSDFLANMSHELRTPMSAMLGFAELLCDPVLSQEQRADYVQRIRDNGRTLLQLIDDILDLSKIESGLTRLDLQDLDPEGVIRQVVQNLQPRADTKAVRLIAEHTPPVPKLIRTDELRLRQILTNLLGNAIKFTEIGEVRVQTAFRNDAQGVGRLIVEVADTGIGMDPAEALKLFQPFVQLDSSISRRYGGTGLGLTLSRHLARLMGGDLELVDTGLGRGSRFRLTLAVGTSPEAPHAAQPAVADALQPGATALKGKRILLAEDAPDNRLLVTTFLKRAGAEVEVASDGVETLERYDSSPGYAAVLLDLQMPRMDGITTLKELRARGCRIPILALTAHALREHRAKGMEAGFDDYITKPVSAQTLVNALLAVLGRQAPEPGEEEA